MKKHKEKGRVTSVIGTVIMLASLAGIVYFGLMGFMHMLEYLKSTSILTTEYMAAARNTLALAGAIVTAEIGYSLRKKEQYNK